MVELAQNQVWAYNKEDSPFARKGDEYIIQAVVLMKIGNEWVEGVYYTRNGDFNKKFVREEKEFLNNFIHVRL